MKNTLGAGCSKSVILFETLPKYYIFLAASKNLFYGILACENSRLSSLLAARESFRQEGRQGLKFHTDDQKSVRNLVRSSDWPRE